jgi:hypothetical protein
MFNEELLRQIKIVIVTAVYNHCKIRTYFLLVSLLTAYSLKIFIISSFTVRLSSVANVCNF